MPDAEEDADLHTFLKDITLGVLACLTRQQFFTALEARIYPEGPAGPNLCDHSCSVAIDVLSASGHDQDARRDILDVMRSLGGSCECEILWNVAPTSAARAAYWRTMYGSRK